MGNDHDGAAQPVCPPSEDDVHQCAHGLARERFGPTRPPARKVSQHVCRDRRNPRRARAAAKVWQCIFHEVPGSCAVRQGHLESG